VVEENDENSLNISHPAEIRTEYLLNTSGKSHKPTYFARKETVLKWEISQDSDLFWLEIYNLKFTLIKGGDIIPRRNLATPTRKLHIT
jgi:hypothetical protein